MAMHLKHIFGNCQTVTICGLPFVLYIIIIIIILYIYTLIKAPPTLFKWMYKLHFKEQNT